MAHGYKTLAERILAGKVPPAVAESVLREEHQSVVREPRKDETRRVYVVSFAPSYDESSIGGFEWLGTRSEAVTTFATLAKDEGTDLRLLVLDLPWDLTDKQITDFLASPHGRALIDPVDPRVDLDRALDLWRHGDDPSELDRGEDTDTVTLTLTVPASQTGAVEDAIDALLDQGTIQDAILERVADLDSLDVEILSATCRRGAA